MYWWWVPAVPVRLLLNVFPSIPSCRVTVLEAGPGLSDADLLAQTGNGLQLPIGAGSPLASAI